MTNRVVSPHPQCCIINSSLRYLCVRVWCMYCSITISLHTYIFIYTRVFEVKNMCHVFLLGPCFCVEVPACFVFRFIGINVFVIDIYFELLPTFWRTYLGYFLNVQYIYIVEVHAAKCIEWLIIPFSYLDRCIRAIIGLNYILSRLFWFVLYVYVSLTFTLTY